MKALKNLRGWISGVLVLGALGIVGFAWLRSTEGVPIPQFPVPPVPSPNAYDTYQQAMQVKQGVGGKLLGKNWNSFTLSQKEQMLASEKQTLALLRSGLGLPYQPPLQRTLSPNFSPYASYRELARTLAAEGELYRQKGNLAQAAHAYTDVIQFGMQLPQGDSLMGFLTGNSMERIGQKYLWEVADKLPASAARSTALRLQEIETHRYPLEKTIQETMYSDLTGMAEFLNKNDAWEIAHQITGAMKISQSVATLFSSITGQSSQGNTTPTL